MSNDVSITLGKKLRELRERAGLSLREVAKAAKVSAPFLSDVELGRRFPANETEDSQDANLLHLAKFLSG